MSEPRQKATLIVRRPKDLAGAGNAFKIFLDDREVGTVGRDQERAIEVEPGAYELVVKVGSGRLTQVRSAACSLKLGPGARQRVACSPPPATTFSSRRG